MIDDFRLFTERQLNILTMVPIGSGLLSIFGSLAVVFIILSDRKEKIKFVYFRIVLMMALTDIFSTGGLVAFNGWAVPEGSPGNLHTRGTTATCNAAGFFLMMLMAPALYTAFLTFYYLLLIRYEVSERVIARYVEPCIHVFALLSPISLGSIAWIGGFFNATEVVAGWCWIGRGPGGCEVYDEIECTRGTANLEAFNMVLLLATSGTIWIFIIVDMVLIVLKVWSQERKLRRYCQGNQTTIRTQQTALQAMLYIIATVVTWSGPVVEALKPVLFSPSDDSYYFPISFTIKFFLPLQGFWNALIFLRPRYREVVESARKMSSVHELASRGAGRVSMLFSLKSNDTGSQRSSVRTTNSYRNSIVDVDAGSRSKRMSSRLSAFADNSSLEWKPNNLDVVDEKSSVVDDCHDESDQEEADDTVSTKAVLRNAEAQCQGEIGSPGSPQTDDQPDLADDNSIELEGSMSFETVKEKFNSLQDQLECMLQGSHLLGEPSVTHSQPQSSETELQNSQNEDQISASPSPSDFQTHSQRKSWRSSSFRRVSDGFSHWVRQPRHRSSHQQSTPSMISRDSIMKRERGSIDSKEFGAIEKLGALETHATDSSHEEGGISIEFLKIQQTLDNLLEGSHFLGTSEMNISSDQTG